MAVEYSPLKMAWWYAREGLPDTPKQIQLILSDLCNQDCRFCAYRMSGYSSNELFVGDSKRSVYGHNNPKRWIPTERALSLLDEFKAAGILAVQFTGGGEPTVHPDHEEIFRRAVALGLRCSLVSNGLKWSDGLIDFLPNFDWVRVSIDAGTPETYAATRNTNPDNFGRVLDHTIRLAAEIGKNRSPCVLGVGYVVTPENWRELRDGVRVASMTGSSYVRMSAMFSQEGAKPYEGIYDQIRSEVQVSRNHYETDRFKVVDLFGERISDLEQGNPDYKTCAYQNYTSLIGGDLKAYRCCVYAYNKRGLILGGDLKDRRFDEFWDSADRKLDFEDFDARGCERCQFNDKNRVMSYILGEKPIHAEFP